MIPKRAGQHPDVSATQALDGYRRLRTQRPLGHVLKIGSLLPLSESDLPWVAAGLPPAHDKDTTALLVVEGGG